jgi:hypothetical protein
LKRLTLEELGNLEVTTASKEPETIRRTPAAVALLTSEDIQRSRVTSLPEALRLLPGVQVARSSRCRSRSHDPRLCWLRHAVSRTDLVQASRLTLEAYGFSRTGDAPSERGAK